MKIKFCGFTKVEDIEFAIKLNVDFQGIVFFSQSKRFVPIEFFDNIAKRITNGNFVGVFVNESIEKVINLAKKYNFRFVQLHGDEDENYTKKVLNEGINVIKAFRIKDQNDIPKIKETPSEFILIDSFVEGQYGGTGKTIEFDLIENVISYNSKICNKKIFLSGGINLKNIDKVMENFGKYIYAIDLSSGIEKTSGIKDHKLMEEIYNKFKNFKLNNFL